MKKFLPMLIALFLLAGCSANKQEAYYAIPSGEQSYHAEDGLNLAVGNGAAKSESDQTAKPESGYIQKIIVSSTIYMECNEMDRMLEQLNTLIAQAGGYIQSSASGSSSRYDRTTDMTIRIPAQNFDDFLEKARGSGNILSESTTADDITSTYYDIDSRISSLEAERERVMEFYKMAANVSELITIEQRLSEIDEEIASLKVRLNYYDTVTNYSTLTLHIYEVKEYTPVEQEGFFAKLGEHIKTSFVSFGEFLQDALFAIIDSFWFILCAVILLILVIRAVKKLHSRRKSSGKKTAELNQKEN